MNLIESCRHFERYHRNSDRKPMTFAAYNAKYGTTLPEGRKDVEQNYHKRILAARKAHGIPVRVRMTSLHQMLGLKEQPVQKRAVKPRLMKNKEGLVGVYTGGTMIRQAWTEKTHEFSPVAFSEATDEDLKTAFMAAVREFPESKAISSKKGMMMHLIPRNETSKPDLKRLSVKLTKTVKPALKDTKGQSAVTAVAKNEVAVKTINREDIDSMLRKIKDKEAGPYFVRLDV
jgi:hypothetical protein